MCARACACTYVCTCACMCACTYAIVQMCVGVPVCGEHRYTVNTDRSSWTVKGISEQTSGQMTNLMWLLFPSQLLLSIG